MYQPQLKKVLTIAIGLVWLINGLFCKVLNLVPRHQEIVARILDVKDARPFTLAIGIAETCMFIWIISRIKSKVCAIFQMVVILYMNVIEFILAPDLLLFGRWNFVFAILLIMIIYFNEFIVTKKTNPG